MLAMLLQAPGGQAVAWAITLGVLLLLVPVAVHLSFGWASRRAEILDAFSSEATSAYLLRFHPSEMPDDPADLADRLAAVYDRHTGRRAFVITTGLMLLGLGLGVAFAYTVPGWLGQAAVSGLAPIAAAALLGAYSFVLFDLVGATIRRALGPRDLTWAMYRFAVIVPIAYAVLAVVKEDFALLVAFSLGTFPSEWLQRFVRRLGQRYLEADATEEERRKGLPIDALDRRVAERLADENITNIVQLAYCDPIVIAIRTNHPLATIVDYVNQALLALYTSEGLAALQAAGIRGARELMGLLGSERSATRTKRLVDKVTEKTGIDPDLLAFTVEQLEANEQAVFVYEMSA